MIEIHTLTDFFNKDYIQYPNYVLTQRAIPSVIDGMKIVQRKIIAEARNSVTTDFIKAFQLVGRASDKMYYHHGDKSMADAIIGLAQTFYSNVPLLDKDGQFGGIRHQVAGESRYISVKLHSNFNKFFKDVDLLEYKYDNENRIEPNTFYPVIPTILCNKSEGIAVGFNSYILPRKVSNIVNLVKMCINNDINDKTNLFTKRFIKLITPHFPENYNGKVEFDMHYHIHKKDFTDKWILYGNIIHVNKNIYVINELPPFTTFDDVNNTLTELLNNKIIHDYTNNSSGNIIEIEIEFNSDIVNNYNLITDIYDKKYKFSLYKLLRLIETRVEYYNLIDENNEFIQFNDVFSIMRYFVNFRLGIYDKRKEFNITKLSDKINNNNNLMRFIKLVKSNKIDLNSGEQSIIKKLDENKLNHSLLDMPIRKLTLDNYKRMEQTNKDYKSEIKTMKNTPVKQMYLEDLK